jgi:hypothetical protein
MLPASAAAPSLRDRFFLENRLVVQQRDSRVAHAG